MPNDYISRKEALCAFPTDAIRYGTGKFENHAVDVIEARARICSIPAADVVPVVHGEWEYKPTLNFEGQGFPRYFCSACENYETRTSRFCPKCGAKMDGGGHNG